jgi:hypothetical protein
MLIKVIGGGFAIRTATLDVKSWGLHPLPNRAAAARWTVPATR